MEHGGAISVPQYGTKRTGGIWKTVNGKRKKVGGKVTRQQVGTTTKRYTARPYMGPALQKAVGDLQRKYPTDLPRMFKAAGGASLTDTGGGSL